VRVNDRGPFADGRIIDLSYAAAAKLGLLGGVAPVTVRRLTFADIRASELLGRGDALDALDALQALQARLAPPLPGAPPGSETGGAICQRPPVTSSTEPVV